MLIWQDVLEYFGMDVSDAKQEQLFRKYDKDKSGFIDYGEFRSMWLRLANPREELEKRGIDIPKYSTPWKLQQLLEATLDEEEANEALVLAEAGKFRQKQREKEQRELLGRKAIIRAEDELAAALDAAGQVYVIGSGKYDQFTGKAVVRDEDLFPGFREVSGLWSSRVDPSTATLRKQAKSKPKERPDPIVSNARLPKKGTANQTNVLGENNHSKSKYVRRRPENKRWKFESPPRLNKQSFKSLKRLVRLKREEEEAINTTPNSPDDLMAKPESSDVESIGKGEMEESEEDFEYGNEDLARLFFEDREFVRSLRFRKTSLMTNTGSLWGRSVVQGTISDSVAYAVTSEGSVFTWGGHTSQWTSGPVPGGDFGSEYDDILASHLVPSAESATSTVYSKTDDNALDTQKLTARSALLKMATSHQVGLGL